MQKQNRHLPAFLLLLLLDGEAHGGTLWSKLKSLLPDQWNIDSGAVYRTLRDLEERGSVSSQWMTEESGPAKRVYAITQKGLEELYEWRKDILLRKQSLEIFLSRFDEHVRSGRLHEDA
ncbi:PadR family transcriptional regulator [Alicyclobacillus sendaiensis]|uniref:PadR family transcriptional regulator n=1 Tax=Alicyclobacillus sendaiensis PA2 TaxID=3029425 RepID=A0ABT6XWX0_ALISE|nr:PadR family transcriptional regulator [Alicyclobacillus sendaiensis]MDI9259586.1 PadR family transcriptional regulator [Alicyclobacillus sendaiensis PA2]